MENLQANSNTFTFNPSQIEDLKRSIVNISVIINSFTGIGEDGTFYGTGLIVDEKEGLVVTNKHVAPEYCSLIELEFSEGASAKAHVIYFDSSHDFVILKYNPFEIKQTVHSVKLGSYSTARAGDTVYTMWNNEGEEYTFKSGHIINVSKSKDQRHSQFMQTTLDLSGGSSGSPVLNESGEVIGIHTRGKESSSFELSIDYVVDKINELKLGDVKRGEIGVCLSDLNTHKAKSFLGVSDGILEEGQEKVLFIKGIIPKSNSEGRFNPGDIILKVDGESVRDSYYHFDRQVDQKVNGTVCVEILRAGKKLDVTIEVDDAFAQRTDEFINWNGGTFHEINPEVRGYYNIPDGAVFMSQVTGGTQLNRLGVASSRAESRRGVVIHQINGVDINSLQDLEDCISELDVDKVSIVAQDYLYNEPKAIYFINIPPMELEKSRAHFCRETGSWIRKDLGEKK